MTEKELEKLARLSIDGELNKHSIEQFCKTYPDITEEEGYRAQEIRTAILEEQGYKVVGYKLGGTSLAKIQQMKNSIYSSAGAVDKQMLITYGRLMDYMQIPFGKDLVLDSKIHPKVEAEFAFIMKEDLSGDDVTVPDVIDATEAVVPAFEIIDSRFHDFKIGRRQDALVDNTSSSGFMLGEGTIDPMKYNLNDVGMKMAVNGEYTGFGAGSSIMGHPGRAVCELVHGLAKVGKGLKKGDIILSGAIAPSRVVKRGDYLRADFGTFGHVEMHVI